MYLSFLLRLTTKKPDTTKYKGDPLKTLINGINSN